MICIRSFLLWALTAVGMALSMEVARAEDLTVECRQWLGDRQRMALDHFRDFQLAPCYQVAERMIEVMQQKLDARQVVLDARLDDHALIEWISDPDFSQFDRGQVAQYQRHVAHLRELIALKASLRERRLGDARLLLDRLAQIRAQLRSDDEDLWDIFRLDAIVSVLDGHGPRAVMRPVVIDSPCEEWVRFHQDCFLVQVDEVPQFPAPSVADALQAMGRDDEAMITFLRDTWVDAAGWLQVPWELRQIAERQYGPVRANAEFEAALSAIRIERGPAGLSAQMPLFNTWLPLPVAIGDASSKIIRLDGNANASDDHGDGIDLNAGSDPSHRRDLTISELQQALRQSWAESDHY